MDYLVPPRMAVCSIANLDSVSNKAKVIWAVLTVHTRMEEMIQQEFKSHQVITTAMSNFLMKNRVDSTQLEAIAAKATKSWAEQAATNKGVADSIKLLNKKK